MIIQPGLLFGKNKRYICFICLFCYSHEICLKFIKLRGFFLINKICDDIYTGIDPDCYHRSIFSASSYIRLEISMKFVLQHRKTLKFIIIAPCRSSSTIVTHASWKKVEIVLIVLEKSFRPFVIIIILTFIAKLTDFRGRNRKSL